MWDEGTFDQKKTGRQTGVRKDELLPDELAQPWCAETPITA